MATKWAIPCNTESLSSPVDGTIVLINGTGFSQLDGKSFVIHAPDSSYFYLLNLEYAGDSSGSYPDSAYIDNEYGASVTTGTVRKQIQIVRGLEHLALLSVEGLGDGELLGPLTVGADGSVTLPTSHSDIILGLPYTTYHEATGVAMNAESGSKTDQTARIHSVSIRFKDTLDAEIATCNGTTTSNDSLTWRSIVWKEDMSVSAETDLFTGLVKTPLESNFSVEPRVILKQDKPLPMNVLSVTYNYKITGGR